MSKEQIDERIATTAEVPAFKEVFADADEARNAAAAGAKYSTLIGLLRSINSAADAQGFYGMLTGLGVQSDEAGNLIIDELTGLPVSDGAAGRLIYFTAKMVLGDFGVQAMLTTPDGKPGTDPELLAAVEVLWKRAFGGPAPTAGDSTSQQESGLESEGKGR